MTQLSAPAFVATPPSGTAKDAFDRLTFLGWRGGLAAIVAGLAVSFFLFGFAVIYWRNADMDFMVIYSALAMNDGKPQQFLDHTAYLTILSIKSWFQLLHGFGLFDAYTLPAIPSAANASAFDAAMTSVVRAARVLAFLIATGCVLIGEPPQVRRAGALPAEALPPSAAKAGDAGPSRSRQLPRE